MRIAPFHIAAVVLGILLSAGCSSSGEGARQTLDVIAPTATPVALNVPTDALGEADLAGRTLLDVDASATDLSAIDLDGTAFLGGSLANAVLDELISSEIGIYYADIDGLSMTDTKVESLAIIGAAVDEVDLSRSQLAEAMFFDTTILASDLSGTNLAGSLFVGELPETAESLTGVLPFPVFANALGFTEAQFEDILAGADLSVLDLDDLRPEAYFERIVQSAARRGIHFGITEDSHPSVALVRAESSALPGIEIAESKMVGANLTEVSMASARLVGVDLTAATLAGTNLADSRLSLVLLTDAELEGVDLSNGELLSVQAQRSHWSGADIEGISITRSNFDFASLQGVDFGRSRIQDTTLRWADLRGADLSDTDLTMVDLTGACADETTALPPGVELTRSATCDPPSCSQCAVVQVIDTLENRVDLGLRVRSCIGPRSACPLAFAFASMGDVLFVECVAAGGLEVQSPSTQALSDEWLLVRWERGPQKGPYTSPVDADLTGWSSPTGTEAGWVSRSYIRPLDDTALSNCP